MISSVSLEAERELTQGALFYAREANADLGLAFIAEFERSLGVLCENPRLGAAWRGSIRRFPLRRFPLQHHLSDHAERSPGHSSGASESQARLLAWPTVKLAGK